MKKRAKKQSRNPKPKRDDLYDVSVMGIAEDDHDKFKAGMLKSAKEAMEAFPPAVEDLLDLFKETYPPHLMAAFASHSFRQYVGPDGVEIRTAFNDVQQYHGEFLQALMLSVPAAEWGQLPVTPETVQKVFDIMLAISAAFLGEGIVSTPEDLGEEELTIRGLQQRIKFHTQGVRNWGYFEHVVQTVRDLLVPLDNQFAKFHQFSGQELVDVLLAVMNEFERRQSEHFRILKKVARGKNYRQVIRLYFRHVPDLEGSADEMIAAVPKGMPKEHAVAMVMSHFDLRLFDLAVFSPAQVAQVSGVNTDSVQLVLNAISLLPGGLASEKPEFFFLGNPVWDRPATRLGDNVYFIPMPQLAFSHVSRIIDRLAKEAGLKTSLEKRRADFLEEQLLDTLQRALPTAEIKSGVKWQIGDDQYETDVLVVQDRIVLIAEAKSHRLTPEGLRGAPKRVKRHIDDLVVSPSLQSARLEGLIEDAKQGDQTALGIIKELGIDPGKVDRVIRLSVTLDDLSVLSAAEQDFKKIGWLPADHMLAPTILITDLGCIAEILDNPLVFYHYMSERYYFQKSFEVLGDELDFLGLYLVSCFNLAGLQGAEMRFTPTGMSSSIDHYYESLHAGVRVPKPKVELGKYFREVVERLGERQPDGWTAVGMHLLSCADPKEQRQLDRDIAKLKSIVRKEYRDPEHICSIQIRPPEERKALVILHFFPKQLVGDMRGIAEQLVSDAMDDSDIEACALISQNIDNRASPFEAAALALKN